MATKPPKLSFDGYTDKRDAVNSGWTSSMAGAIPKDGEIPSSQHRTTTIGIRKNMRWKKCSPIWNASRSIKECEVHSGADDGHRPRWCGRRQAVFRIPAGMEKNFLSQYSGEDHTVLAERITFLDTCKQRLHEGVAELEPRCKYHGLWCEYLHMAKPEEARRSCVITKNQGQLSEDSRVHAYGHAWWVISISTASTGMYTFVRGGTLSTLHYCTHVHRSSGVFRVFNFKLFLNI